MKKIFSEQIYLKGCLKIAKITIKYNSKPYNLCRGSLVVIIDKREWVFPENCLKSGRYVGFDENWSEVFVSGDWAVSKWPKGFPKELKKEVLGKINSKIPHGCCGGCV